VKRPALIGPPSRSPNKSLVVRLLWMAAIWVASVAGVLILSLILRTVLHR